LGVTALVMAGGKGSRMRIPQEKPLIKVCGKPVVEYVLEALSSAKHIERVVVAVSDSTPKTTAFLEQKQSVSVLQTPGKDYVSDLGYAANKLGLAVFLAVGADLPLITREIVDEVILAYLSCGKPALTVAVPLSTKERLGMCVEYAFDHCGKRVVPAGINVIDGRKRYGDEWLDQEIMVLDKKEVAVNINTVAELELAENLLVKQST
jgi:adenosylcobinamide-phosphate guanylyltransferase